MAFTTERDRLAYERWKEEDEREQAAIAERIEAPIKLKQLEKEISQNTTKLWREKRKQTLGYEEQPYISAELQGITMSIEEANAFNGCEAREFMKENPEYYPSEENRATLLDYFTNRGINIIDRKMLKSAFISLRRDGLFDEPEPVPVPVPKPAPVAQEESFDNLPRLPLGHTVPTAYKRQTQEKHRGIDPDTGKQRDYTQLEVDRMSADQYKKIFTIPTTYLSKGSFLR